MIKIKKGLDLPLAGLPKQQVETAPQVTHVALLGADYLELKPSMEVKEGDEVRLGQVLFTDKKMPGIRYTAPAGGRVVAIHRGAKRVFESLVIARGEDRPVVFESFLNKPADSYSRQEVRALLLESGLWPALRTRPFSKVANPETTPHSLFVTAMDTNPLALDPQVVFQSHGEEFKNGLKALAKLTDGSTYLCKKAGSKIPGDDLTQVKVKEFAGPHPAGNVGTHIHFVDPVSKNKTVWHIGYQDVVALGHLLKTGQLWAERYLTIAGPSVRQPRAVKTRLGASLEELTRGELTTGTHRVISGPVLSGRKAAGNLAYLGKYHTQVSVIPEDDQREFLGWMSLGLSKFSVKRTFLGSLFPKRLLPLTTSTHGSPRSFVPIGSYEKVMPLDLMVTPLLRYLLCHDSDMAQSLGCLELDEEDLALCTYVCPSKIEYGPILRTNLQQIEKEG